MASPYLLELPESPVDVPKHVRIADAIAADIARGRLAPGARLPGSRALASMVGVHRNTANAAYAELAAQGWVEPMASRGVFVRAQTLDPRPRRRSRSAVASRAKAEHPCFALAPAPRSVPGKAAPTEAWVLTGGVPDPRLFPHELLARAYRRALRSHGSELLDYGDAYGELRLRTAVADMLRTTRGLSVGADEVLITRGSQQALWLAAQAMFIPGARVAVESFGYVPAWDAFRHAGGTLVPVPVDSEGLDVAALERRLTDGPIAAVYVTPHHQYPTMVAMSAPRRLALLELARAHRFAILEDDYTHEFHYEGRPRLPIAAADRHGSVVYVGTLSKILAPGLRIGYAVAPRALLERMASLRTFVDRQGDAIAEAAVAELFEDGEVLRHARRMRAAYHARRDALVEALERTLGDRVHVPRPHGGMALWIRMNEGNPERWAANAAERGVRFRPGSDMQLDGRSVPYVRMGFTRHDEDELRQAARQLARAFPR